jgi:soluble lytic murein transglycosylase
MTYDFSLQDIMGNFTGGPAVPDDMPNYGTVSTATTQMATTPPIPGQSTTYDRMLQAESGNRNYDAQGRPITSPKGAMFASQVMPSTAAAPGYGVRPAQSQTPEEYNRVGREYYQALLNKFGGDEQAAAAAYNAGPGKVQQNISQNNGQLNVAQLPKETQGYLGKVLQGVGNAVNGMIPSAQAGTLPPQPSAPQPNLPVMKPAVPSNFQGQTDEFGGVDQAIARQAQQPFTGQGLKFGGKTQEQLQQEQVQQQQLQQHTDVLNSDDREGIAKLAFGVDTPKDVQMAALNKLHKTMEVANSMDKAKQKMEELSANPDARALTKVMNDSKLGAYAKVLMYTALNWHGKARELLDEIDPKITYGSATVGDKNYYVGTDANGKVREAWDGQKWVSDPKVLNDIGANNMALGKGVHVTKTDTYIDPETGQVVNHQVFSNSKERYTSGGTQYTGDPSKLVLEHAHTANENRKVDAVRKDLLNKYPNPTPQQLASALGQAGLPNRRIESELGLAPGTLSKQKQQPQTNAGPQVNASQAGGGGAQAAQAAQAQAQTQNQALANTFNTGSTEFRGPMPGESKQSYESAKKAFDTMSAKDIKQADDFGKTHIATRNGLEDLKQAVAAVGSGKHYIGPMFGSSPQAGQSAGALPGVQEFFGGKFGDQTNMNNTILMRSLMTRQGLTGIKDSMGPSISNFDVQAWLKSNPVNENSSPEQLLQYFTRLHNQMYDMAQKDKANAVKYGQVSPDFDLGTRLPDFRTNTGGGKQPDIFNQADAILNKKKK